MAAVITRKEVRNINQSKIRSNRAFFLLILLAFVWRLFFISRYAYFAGDSYGYDLLARNWLQYHFYGFLIAGVPTPVDFRVPGYPAFLATVYWVLGYSRLAVMVVQALLDSATCVLAARLAEWISPQGWKRQARNVTLALAALVPFLPCYVATLLSEVPATFFTMAAILLAIKGLSSQTKWAWLGSGVLTGIAVMMRPDSGLLVPILGVSLLVQNYARVRWRRLLTGVAAYSAGLLLVFAPWTVRNAVSLKRFQPLAPRYAQMPDEYVPKGYLRWVRTWLVKYRDINEAWWKLNEEPIHVSNLPDTAFDSPAERARVGELLEHYNQTTTITPEVDRRFAELAAERIARYPWRYYFTVPARRILTLWLTPRVETLPYSGELWPPKQRFKEDPADFLITLTFGGVNMVLLVLAGTGLVAWQKRVSHLHLLLLVGWIVTRSLFLSTVEGPEPRYVLECYPVVFVFASLGIMAMLRRTTTTGN